MTRVELLDRLRELQSMDEFKGRDITTISALLSNKALADHIKVCENAVSSSARSSPRGEDAKASGHAAAN
ncbi:hypothetical protein [Chelativorans sp. Marseille-P2723]|uniref:hypothetical protein n=1 Tax=Chelativorans sp. Marseille-P2723 TaxID=2709133 RepID=UPI00156E824F|nr:hypothetical protein [Chelativorans sp. Marseille-P2723]